MFLSIIYLHGGQNMDTMTIAIAAILVIAMIAVFIHDKKQK